MVQNLNVFQFKRAVLGIEKSYVHNIQLCVAKNMEAPHKLLYIKGNILCNTVAQKKIISLKS